MARTQYKMVDMERKRKQLHYIYTSRSLSYKPACLGCSLHKHRMTVATPLVTDPAWSRRWGKGTMFCVDVVDSGEGEKSENPLSVRPNQGSPWYGLMPPPNYPSSYSPTSQVQLPFGAGLLHCRSSPRSSISMWIFLYFYRLLFVMSLCLMN